MTVAVAATIEGMRAASRRSVALSFVIAFAFLLLCLPSAALARPPLELKVFQLPDLSNASPGAVAEREVINAFYKRHPNIVLKAFSGISIEDQADESRILMAIAAKTAPDVMYVNFRQSDTYIRQGFLHPLDEYVAEMPQDELSERVPKPVWPVIKRKGADDAVHTWAMPYNMVLRTLSYRRDLFRKAGLDPNRPPKDWNELLDYVKRLTDPQKGTYGISLNRSPVDGSYEWITFLWSAGGEAMTLDDKGEWHVAFDSDAAAEAMLYYMELVADPWEDATGRVQHGYAYGGTFEARTQLWNEGRVAMRITYINPTYVSGDPDKEGLGPVPLGPTGQRGAELNCMMMGIFAGIQGRGGYSAEEIRRAAWDYIRFYASDEARRIRTRILVEAGQGKALSPRDLKKFGYAEYVDKYSQEWARMYESVLEAGRPEPYGKNCQMIYSRMTEPLNECVKLAEEGKLGNTREEKLAKIKTLLHEAVRKTNIEMLGRLEPAERRKRNTIAFIAAVAIFAAFLFAVKRVWVILTPEEHRASGGWRWGRYKWAYIILIPALVSIFLWQYVPMILGSGMVVQDYHVVGASRFTGVLNFADVLWDAAWWSSLLRTVYYMVLIFALGFWTPIALAILLHEVSHFKVLYRVVYYLPAALTGFVVIYLWKLFFDPTSVGTLNQLLTSVGLPPLKWLNDSRLAMLCCVVPSVWAGLGPGCLIYLAALKAVPDDLYEAADIDGCGFWGKTRHITLPTLKTLIIIQFISTFIAATQGSGCILVMTGMAEATKVADLHIFEQAYLYLRFGAAITMAWILGVLLLIFTVQQLKILSRLEFRAAGAAKK